MSIISLLIPLSLILVVVAVWAFIWAVNSGQFDDLDTPAWDMLSDDPANTEVPATAVKGKVDSVANPAHIP